MVRRVISAGVGAVLVAGCGNSMKPSAEPPSVSSSPRNEMAAPATDAPAPAKVASPEAAEDAGAPFWASSPMCEPIEWKSRSLKPLLKSGKKKNPSYPDQANTTGVRIDASCADHPDGPPTGPGFATGLRGLVIHLDEVTPAGKSGRGWPGNQCTISFGLSRVSSNPVQIGPEVLPPFNGLTSLVWKGSAVWVELSFNGYTKDFPTGGNRVVALDLCYGRVAWKSDDGISNGGLLLVGDYLITTFGFTNEPRFVHVLDAYTGELIQKLPVIENICPSKAFAPNWKGGRCDAPGQKVGAATNPRIEGGLLLVDTNTGSSAFEIE